MFDFDDHLQFQAIYFDKITRTIIADGRARVTSKFFFLFGLYRVRWL